MWNCSPPKDDALWEEICYEYTKHNVERYGNISSAALPALLDELNRGGKLQKGDKLVFSAFGAGFTTGACVIEWAK